MEDIQKRIGTPSEIIQEFNSSFSEEEQKKYKREKWGKRGIILAVVLIVLIVGINWIIPKGNKIEESDTFQKEKVEEAAKEVIRLLNEQDYETLAENSDEKMKPSMTEKTMEEAKNSISADWGEFQSFGKVYTAQVTQMGKTVAVAQINASYENVSITYTISFDKEMKLAGLYMK